MNFCFLTGFISSVPTLRFSKNNKPITNFNLALGINQPPASGITVVCFDDMATPTAQYLRVGDHIGVEGNITRKEIPYGDGKEVVEVVLVAFEIQKSELVIDFLGLRESLPGSGMLPGPTE